MFLDIAYAMGPAPAGQGGGVGSIITSLLPLILILIIVTVIFLVVIHFLSTRPRLRK